MKEKNCSICKRTLPLSKYRRDKSRKDGHRSDCKDCSRNRDLKARFGISVETYEKLLLAQNGVCAICGKKPGKIKLAVDHDHSCCPGRTSCGKCIRGLLCKACNRELLGMICQESTKGADFAVEVLKRAIEYLTSLDDTIVV